jgi:transposase
MAIGRQRDRQKQQQWERWVRSWRASGLSVRAFCGEHGLSEASFYAWRRTLQRRQQTTVAVVPVHVLDDAPPGALDSGAADSGAALEVVLPGRCVVRVGPGFDAATLRRLLALLEGKPC